MSDATGHEGAIGLEIHVQLKTRTKMFCRCPVEFGAPPNTRVCPVCLGLPGALPTVNARAVELSVRTAVALECTVHARSIFARKNYFYPDLPKGYQITQYDRPLATAGALSVSDGAGKPLRVRIRRLHLEEDAGKSIHDRFTGRTAVDLNRAGTPLMEVVTEPDLRTPAQARAFVTRLKRALEHLEVSDCNMEEGSLRVDANLSVRRVGTGAPGPKTEIKNLNSFRQLERALEYERARQAAILAGGRAVVAQTMAWDEGRGECRRIRGKEEAEDYRYFPEPDLPPLVVEEAVLGQARADRQEMPWDRAERFVHAYGLPAYDADVLTASRPLADYYEGVAALVDPKAASNWVMGEVLAICNERALGVEGLGLAPEALAAVITRVADGTLSRAVAKDVLRRILDTGQRADEIVEAEGLEKVRDANRLAAWVSEVMEENAAEVERYRTGERKLLEFFVGQVMRKSRDRADPGRVRGLMVESLER